jgi:hypothetical protein
MWPELIGSKLSAPTIITSQSGNLGASDVLGAAWTKPTNCTWIYLFMIGGGGGGGGGQGTSADVDTGGGGGGSAGSYLAALMPAQFVPDVLLFSLGGGGPGGDGGVLANGAAGTAGGPSRLYGGATLTQLASCPGGTLGTGGLSTFGGTGGPQPALPLITTWLSSGLCAVFQGIPGVDGGFGADGVAQGRSFFCGGAGGGGARTGATRVGGALNAIFQYALLPGGSATSAAASRVLYGSLPFIANGGTGGFGSNPTSPGGAGGAGWFGCGGGGGGSCSNGGGSATGGAGGRGGDGIAFIWSF